MDLNRIGPGIVGVIAALIGLAIVAVIVSGKAQTPKVISSAGSALANVIGAAVAPVTGGTAANQFGGVGNITGGAA
jgi:hypothetical protein